MASRYAIDTTGVERFASLLGNSDEIKAAAEEQRRQEALAQAYNRARLESERAQGQQYGLENERLAGRNQALSELTQAFLQMGMENPEAHATLIRASENIDPAKLGDYMTDYATRQQRGGAIDAYQGGDTGLANMLLAAGGRDPVQQTEVQGDVAFNPNIGPSQPMQPTPAFTAELAQNARQPVDYTPLNGTVADVFTQPIINDKGEVVVNPYSQQPVEDLNEDALAEFMVWWGQNKGQYPDQNVALPVWIQQGGLERPEPPPAPPQPEDDGGILDSLASFFTDESEATANADNANTDYTQDEVLSQARQALANGKDPQALAERLRQMGVAPEAINAVLQGG